MAEEPEKNPQEPDLELPPLLGFGRKKRARKAGRGSGEPVSPVSPDDGQGAGGEPGAVSDAEATAAEGQHPLSADPVPEPRGGLAPATGATKRLPPVPPPSRSGGAPTSRISSPPPASEPEQSSDRPAGPPATSPGRQSASAPPPAPVPAPETPVAQSPADETSVLPAVGRRKWRKGFSKGNAPEAVADDDHGDTMTVTPTSGATAVDQEQGGRPGQNAPVEGSAAPRKPRKSPSLKLPVISPLIAAAVTGLLVGLLTVVLTYLANRGCEGVRGVSSCGRLGLLALLAVVAVDIVVGATLLKAWRLADPTSTAFLGVGLMAVFALLFLLNALESSWMLLVMPLVGAAAFLASWWVTTTFVEDNLDVSR